MTSIHIGILRFTASGLLGFVLFLVGLCWTLWLHSTDDGLDFQEAIGPVMTAFNVIAYLLFLFIGLWLATKGFTHNPLNG